MIRRVLAVALCALALAPSALACPTCGLSSRVTPALLVVYGLFLLTPFVLFGFLARYIRHLDRRG